jgi:DNA polymerase III subunit gamma/tau
MTPAYQPLHHKYRPQRLDQLVGQEAIAATLAHALRASRIAPAYLFSGPRGTGKTSSARILARSLNCIASDGPTPDPCGVCELCTSIAAGNALDVIEIDAASNTGVDNIRELIERSRFAPVQARWKVYVVDECHMLSTAAFNALLKTLEEPPPRVVFVLATTDPQRVLPTILSRCQRFDFRRIPLQALEGHLGWIAEQEQIGITPEALHVVAQRAQGGLRDAESLLDQLSLLPPPIEATAVWELLGAVPEQELLELAKALAGGEALALLETCRGLLEHGREPSALLQGLASLLRDLVLAGVAPDRLELTSVSPQLRDQLPALARRIGKARLLEWQAQLRGSEQQLRHSVNPRLWLEVLLLGLLHHVAATAAAAAPAAAAAADPIALPTPTPTAPAPAPAQRHHQRPPATLPWQRRSRSPPTWRSCGPRSWPAWSCPPPACCSPNRRSWCGSMTTGPWCRWPAPGWPWCRPGWPWSNRPSPARWAVRANWCWKPPRSRRRRSPAHRNCPRCAERQPQSPRQRHQPPNDRPSRQPQPRHWQAQPRQARHCQLHQPRQRPRPPSWMRRPSAWPSFSTAK